MIDTRDTICIMIAMCLRRSVSADAADKGENNRTTRMWPATANFWAESFDIIVCGFAAFLHCTLISQYPRGTARSKIFPMILSARDDG